MGLLDRFGGPREPTAEERSTSSLPSGDETGCCTSCRAENVPVRTTVVPDGAGHIVTMKLCDDPTACLDRAGVLR